MAVGIGRMAFRHAGSPPAVIWQMRMGG